MPATPKPLPVEQALCGGHVRRFAPQNEDEMRWDACVSLSVSVPN